jgi:hypothetical protein
MLLCKRPWVSVGAGAIADNRGAPSALGSYRSSPITGTAQALVLGAGQFCYVLLQVPMQPAVQHGCRGRAQQENLATHAFDRTSACDLASWGCLVNGPFSFWLHGRPQLRL